MTRVLGLDPGQSTGWAAFLDAELVATGVIYGGSKGFKAWTMTEEGEDYFYGAEVIVIEDYDEDGGGRPGGWSLKIIGAVEFSLASYQKLFFQKRGAKGGLVGVDGFTADAAESRRFAWLKRQGFEDAGGGHNLDAITHVIVWGKQHMRREFYGRYFS